ncbi:acyl-CoA dehydrogenase family protein, partial [Achromobacter ruhlandii]|uniref:acyl-CoA dehydrogenase family protein n=1 Tax=Achromobacter ruhlandii TaxID=72557 RepID=UPI002015F139
MESMLGDAANRLFAQTCTPDVIRQAEQGQPPAQAWQACEDAGFADALVPESRGGAGLALADALPLATAAGRHLRPLPTCPSTHRPPAPPSSPPPPLPAHRPHPPAPLTQPSPPPRPTSFPTLPHPTAPSPPPPTLTHTAAHHPPPPPPPRPNSTPPRTPPSPYLPSPPPPTPL